MLMGRGLQVDKKRVCWTIFFHSPTLWASFCSLTNLFLYYKTIPTFSYNDKISLNTIKCQSTKYLISNLKWHEMLNLDISINKNKIYSYLKLFVNLIC